MNRQPVSSSNVRSVGYDSASSTLEVAFHNGGVYQYFGVPSTVYAGLMAAASKGRYLHHYVKGRYRYSKVF
ncbi:KTSC domain-containing protein [Oscillatoria sp. CS-180]|uniref:KTSC domain-containing protein n=1 Tax=Oscillatoria sp. CS-180 TaxID=3021720 RepID=UPI0023303786|nr:KTSC domain-containing protein [Oscillatoria sp. CS-180]MDB9528729.1 KTSC domain-containing protein [Oscillatoria sp. CS-180]